MIRAISSVFQRGNLLAGVALIVFVAVGPTVGVLMALQADLLGERDAQARALALRRAELVSATVGSVVEGARQMMVALAANRRVQTLSPLCGGLLDELRRGAQAYAFLAVLRPSGEVVCSSADPPLAAEPLAAVAQPLLAATRFTTGQFARVPGLAAPVLTFGLPATQVAGQGAALLIAGLDLTRLGTLLAGLPQPAHGQLVIADRAGTVLARAPESAAAVGEQAPAVRTLLSAPAAGTVEVDGADGERRVVGYVPSLNAADGLFVSAGFGVSDVVGGMSEAAKRAYLLIWLGAALSVLLTLLIGHRFLRAPASVLLQAARRWGSGDLSVRATMPRGAMSEFTGLGVAFNEMAELLQQQRAELQSMNDALEMRVAERTRALLESNNRLQVEIAERELTEANLRQAQKLQAVGQLAGGMAHDFNNLLTAILGSLELLRKRLPGGDGRPGKLLEVAMEAVARGSRLTAQLLAFSRKQPLLAVSVNVVEAIQGMAGLLSSTLGPKIELQTRVDAELWPAMLDPNQFEAAILNLALNGRDAMPGGGRLVIAASNVVITPASPWQELEPGSYVRVAVSDTGTGMAAEVVTRAYEPFFTTKPHGEGSGLGLSQVHGMVRQSGGGVSIESRPGGGTTVCMMFPRSTARPAADALGADITVPVLGRNRAVLLVDDDNQVREVTEAVLVDAGYTVVTAAGGTEALATLDEAAVEVGLVIADYAMPGMTGRELLQRVKQRRPEMAVLLATGYADYPELISEDLPMDQIVRKPFRTNELLARIHLVVQRQESGAVPA